MNINATCHNSQYSNFYFYLKNLWTSIFKNVKHKHRFCCEPTVWYNFDIRGLVIL